MKDTNKNFKDLAFESQIGHRATVDRDEDANDLGTNAGLREIGRILGQYHNGFEYKGSAAFHLYLRKSEAGLVNGDILEIITQTNTVDTDIPKIVNKGMQKLDKDLDLLLTGKRKVNRAGF